MTWQEPDNAESRNLIIQLASSDEKRRREAEQRLAEQGLNTIENLRMILKAEHRRRHKMRRPLAISRWVMFFLLSLLYYFYAGRLPGTALTLFLVWFTGFLISILRFRVRHRFDLGMAVALSQFDDVNLIAPLLEVGVMDKKDLLQPLLIRLLPRLQASDAPLLKEYHRNKLYFQLSLCYGFTAHNTDTEFVLAILKALEQIGDEKAIKSVEKVAEKAKNQRIREAAAECLVFLKTREADGKYQLLRASGASTPDLLRPVAETEAPQSNILLRSASSFEEN